MLPIYFEKEEVRACWIRAGLVGKIYFCGSVFSFSGSLLNDKNKPGSFQSSQAYF